MNPWAMLAVLAITSLACGSSQPAPTSFVHSTLTPYAPLYGPGDPYWTPQPHRDRPLRVAVTPDGTRAYVTLQGYEDEPGHEVSVVDLASRRVLHRISVGSSPTGIAIHPGGRFAVVTNRYANWASVIDLTTDTVVLDVPTDYYATDVAFTPDGQRAYVTNRWKNEVVRWDLAVTAERFEVRSARAAAMQVHTHPRDVAVSPDGTRLAVAALDGLRVSLFSLPDEHLVADVFVLAPVNDVLFAGPWLLALTQGPGDGHPALVGPDFDQDGRPGDSTANVNFQDQQNDIAIYRASDGSPVRRYTYENLCCRDFRDVSPDDPTLGMYVPRPATWIIGGTIPEAGVLCGSATAPTLWVAYLGSSEAEAFSVDLTSGTLTRTVRHAGAGFGPSSIACAGTGAAVVTSLSESLSLLGAQGESVGAVPVGDLSGGSFPATDAEIGEMLNVATAPFTVDSGQSCVMCHREFGDPDKPFSMPLLLNPEGTRMTMAHRGMADTRPWFFEAAMDDTNFFPVLNEFARMENFCCSDPTVFTPDHPAPMDCEQNPPPVCATRPWPRNLPTRDVFYLTQAQHVLGRTRTIGDAFDSALNFQGLTHALGLSLLIRSRLLANPNPRGTPSVQRGAALFASAELGCATCHTGAGFAASTSDGPGVRLHFGPVISVPYSPDGRNLDLVSAGFQGTFPDLVQDAQGVEFGVTTLRNLWAHASLFLHDGRAHSLREAILTPGHAALLPGEHGYNETNGIPNTHGATSQLLPDQVDDLIAYMLSL